MTTSRALVSSVLENVTPAAAHFPVPQIKHPEKH